MSGSRRIYPALLLAACAMVATGVLVVKTGRSAAQTGRQTAAATSVALASLEQPGLAAGTGAGLDVDPASVAELGSYALPGGGRHELYRATARNGWTCILEERPVGTTPAGRPLAIYGGGCSPAGASAHELRISISAGGNVDEAAPAGLSIVGVAGTGIARVEARLADGSVTPLVLSKAGGFHFADPSGRSVPRAIVGFDTSGRKAAEVPVR